MIKPKNIFKNMDLLKLLIILIVVVVVVRILFAVQSTIGNKTNNNPVQNSTNTANLNKPNVNPTDIQESEDLLSHLPFSNQYFKANYLPLEKDTPATIIVQFYLPGVETQFKKWVDQYKYSADTKFIYYKAGTEEPK